MGAKEWQGREELLTGMLGVGMAAPLQSGVLDDHTTLTV